MIPAGRLSNPRIRMLPRSSLIFFLVLILILVLVLVSALYAAIIASFSFPA